jgi:hypothetical protein
MALTCNYQLGALSAACKGRLGRTAEVMVRRFPGRLQCPHAVLRRNTDATACRAADFLRGDRSAAHEMIRRAAQLDVSLLSAE